MISALGMEKKVHVSDESVLSGLRSLSLGDLPRYTAAVNQSKRIGWQHYFPFLFLFSRKGHSESLSGGKTRNLRHNLMRIDARGDIELRPYEAADAAECLALLDEWWEMQKDKHEHFDYQRHTKACLNMASQFAKTDLFGKVILVDGRIRSFGFAGEMREGVANLFVGYSDHTIKGLNYYMVYQLMLDMEGYEIANASRADTPGVKFAKEVLCPVSMHDIYRIHQDTA